ncbi:polysaccharide biosynthesis protein [Metaclostridioides mangenotii]|uniref:FlaA1/EpsC-like NDP-sugar epimerase n=1 Tax=Metaclostridioides mangenotii TaxID=1540 RepID=A0ABS4EBJ7_9FIRM|nr:nucleoside-diphosphate sugar epimerase/dehydratase [Clostridioides mangenotii]MBP1855307.1 FlaA1/EpsC-like NDP-sugar epimerase [Clostridioides mangenotii]
MERRFRLSRDSFLAKLLKRHSFRHMMLVVLDAICILVAFELSLNLTTTSTGFYIKGNFIPLIVYIILHIITFIIFRCYSTLWRYAGEEGIISIFAATFAYLIPVVIVHKVIGYNYSVLFYILNTISIIMFTLGYRITYRAIKIIINRTSMQEGISNVLIIGAGNAGEMVVQELNRNPRLRKSPVAIIDDDPNKRGRVIHNVKIVGTSDEIPEIVDKYEVNEIIFSIANINNQKKKDIIDICKNTNSKIKTIPGIYEIIDGKVNIKQIRDVRIEDLLGREPIEVDYKDISNYIAGKNVIVTGGGGSIGSELCRQIASFNPNRLIILDNYENNAYAIQQELIRKYGDKLDLVVVIASIREKKRLDEIFDMYRPEIVFHAAAHKHVPLMEFSPSEAIKNNIFGTLNTAKVASKYNVERFVLISTDKAVNPTNIMGATKRAAEMIIQTMNEESKTEFVAVRFGNVLGSNGSVIPLFKKQIEDGGPVTVTHPMIIRYFMTIPEAVGLVIQAGAMAKGGEIFVLDMGEPVKILDLANNLIKFSGLEPGVDIKIKFTGLRPGEKLYEELLMSEEGLLETRHKKIFIGKPININREKIDKILKELQMVTEDEETDKIESLMKTLVTTYTTAEKANEREIAITKIDD